MNVVLVGAFRRLPLQDITADICLARDISVQSGHLPAGGSERFGHAAAAAEEVQTLRHFTYA